MMRNSKVTSEMINTQKYDIKNENSLTNKVSGDGKSAISTPSFTSRIAYSFMGSKTGSIINTGSVNSIGRSVIGLAMAGSGLMKSQESRNSMSRRTMQVSKQLRPHNSLNDKDLVENVDLFQCVLHDRVDLIKRYLDLRGLTTLNLRKYGDGKKGPTLIHWAYLYKKFDTGRMLISYAPEHVLDVVNSPLFAGENVLHMAITHGYVDEVRHICKLRGVYKDKHGVFRNTLLRPAGMGAWTGDNKSNIMEEAKANKTLGNLLSRQAANGSFFARGTPYDFGELPLFFAVATNQPDMVDTILMYCFDTPRARFYALIECNRYGDNVLHYCARQNLVDMYKHLVSIAMNILEMFGETALNSKSMEKQHSISAMSENAEYHLLFKTFAHKINIDGRTPLTIAAELGLSEMFDCIMTTWR